MESRQRRELQTHFMRSPFLIVTNTEAGTGRIRRKEKKKKKKEKKKGEKKSGDVGGGQRGGSQQRKWD